jgi:hypothetical protein
LGADVFGGEFGIGREVEFAGEHFLFVSEGGQ